MFTFTPRHLTKIREETQQDPILSMVHRLTLEWLAWQTRSCPQSGQILLELLWWTLHWHGDLLTKGEWVVIPPSCRDKHHGRPPGKPCIGINKAMDLARTCIYWPGMEADMTDYIKQCLTYIECSNLPVEMLQPHEVPPGPWVKDRCWLLSRPFGKKAPHSSRLLQQVPIHVSSGICTSFQDHYSLEGTLCSWRCTHHCHVWQWTSIQWSKEFRQFAHEFDFMHTTSSPHFHQSNGFIKAMVKKAKNAYKKTDGSPNAQTRALLQLCDTPIMADLPSPAEILHGCPAQGSVLSRPSKMCQYMSDSAETHSNFKKNRRKTLTKPTEPKCLCVLKGQGTSLVLPQQARHRPHQVDNWYSDWNIGMWTLIHGPGPPWQSLQEK